MAPTSPTGHPRRGRPPLMAVSADEDTMTTAEVASHLGLSRREAGRWLRRHGIHALGRGPGAAGQNLYPGELIRRIRRERFASPPTRSYDPWRDAKDTHVHVGARVEQIAVAKEHGALAARLNKHGVVISLGGLSGRGYRLRVRFEGETEPASIRPHLVRVMDS
jgi:hypothetical protein